jgi:hypothetical protein
MPPTVVACLAESEIGLRWVHKLEFHCPEEYDEVAAEMYQARERLRTILSLGRPRSTPKGLSLEELPKDEVDRLAHKPGPLLCANINSQMAALVRTNAELNGRTVEEEVHEELAFTNLHFYGICPHCGQRGAVGTICEGCGKDLRGAEQPTPYNPAYLTSKETLRAATHGFSSNT